MLLWLADRHKEYNIVHQFFLLLIKHLIQNDVRENSVFVLPTHKEDISFSQSIILLQHRLFYVSRYWRMFLVSDKMLQYTGAQIFQKSRSFLRILGTSKVTWSTFDTKDSRIVGDTVQSVVTLAPGIFARYFEKERRIFEVCVLLTSLYRRKRMRDELSITKVRSSGCSDSNQGFCSLCSRFKSGLGQRICRLRFLSFRQ